MWRMIVQRRLVFIVGVVGAAVALALIARAKTGIVSEVCSVLLLVLMLGLIVASLLALNAPHPATFVAREGTFTTPPSANEVLSVPSLTVLLVAQIGLNTTDLHWDVGADRLLIAIRVMLLLLLPLVWYSVLGPYGVFLRPDGVLDRQLFGSLFVPWEAGPAARPTGFRVALRVSRPDLVVRRGWRRGTTINTGADRGFTAWAINLYAARPDYRATIGSEEGLRQLRSFVAST